MRVQLIQPWQEHAKLFSEIPNSAIASHINHIGLGAMRDNLQFISNDTPWPLGEFSRGAYLAYLATGPLDFITYINLYQQLRKV